MKYGESFFDIAYLGIAIVFGILILKKAQNRTEKWMGLAVLILGCGDAFHLVPRVLNYFIDADFQAALGIGKLVTSVTMTVFYVLLYYIGRSCYPEGKKSSLSAAVWSLAAIRVIICLFPQNGWFQNESSMIWGIYRNISFVALGAIVMILFLRNRKEIPRFRLMWLWILLSFLFYIPVAVFAGLVPMLGMLMLPKTICYIIMIITFYQAVSKHEITEC